MINIEQETSRQLRLSHTQEAFEMKGGNSAVRRIAASWDH
jgi:hypothetical protein